MPAAGVVVVGAGPAGLAAAARLRESGLDPIVLERSDSVGSAWRTRYDSFRLHTIRWLSGLPGVAIPAGCGSWVARDAFIDYLEGYADRFAVAPRFGVELRGLTPAASGDSWRLETSAGELDADRVVFATGASADPNVPAWPGRDSFARPVLHSSQYRNPVPYSGQRVLVVGSGNSATEIAADLAAAGDVRVELAVRTAPMILRRDTYGIPTQLIGIATRYAPAPVIDSLAAVTRRVTIPNLSGYGLPAPRRPYSQFRRTGTLPVLDHGFVGALRSGAITVRAAISELDGREVAHCDGSRSAPDTVIAATGYHTGLQAILGPLGLVDERGFPSFGSRGAGTRAPGLYAVGLDIVLSGMLREIGRDADRLARAIR